MARVAGGQAGRIGAVQLRHLGVGRQTSAGWVSTGYLYPELPGVYAVGHPGRSEESDLFAAILYAGPGGAIRGLSAALWRDMVKWRTAWTIEVSTPRQRRSLPSGHPDNRLGRTIDVRERRPPERHLHKGLPTVPIADIVLDLAARGDLELVRFALAQLDYMRVLNVPALERRRGRGIPGSAILGAAIAHQQPQLARARSPFEVRLLEVCELTGIPLPELNVRIGGVRPDAVWRDEMLVVECDGEGNHGTWRQRRRDAEKDLVLRGLGFLAVRYVYAQLADPWAIHADLTPLLRERAGRARVSAPRRPGRDGCPA